MTCGSTCETMQHDLVKFLWRSHALKVAASVFATQSEFPCEALFSLVPSQCIHRAFNMHEVLCVRLIPNYIKFTIISAEGAPSDPYSGACEVAVVIQPFFSSSRWFNSFPPTISFLNSIIDAFARQAALEEVLCY